MNLTNTHPRKLASENQRSWQRRASSVALTIIAGVTFWLMVVVGFGNAIQGPGFDGSQPVDVGVAAVIAAIAVSTLAGWALLIALERVTSRAAIVWTVAAIGFTLVSLGGPLAGSGVSTADRAALVALHLITAGVYVPLMRRTITASRPDR